MHVSTVLEYISILSEVCVGRIEDRKRHHGIPGTLGKLRCNKDRYSYSMR